MTQVRTDAATPQAHAGPPGATRLRPLSPHLQVWRWHVTMAASIATRATGVALYGAALIVAAGAACLASGPGAYGVYLGVMGSIVGKLALFAITVSIFYHLAAGIRHLVWDAGKGFAPRTANMSAIFAFVFGFVAAALVWAIAFALGAA